MRLFFLQQLNLLNNLMALDLGSQPAGTAENSQDPLCFLMIAQGFSEDFGLIVCFYCYQRSSLGQTTIFNTVQLSWGAILLQRRSTRSLWKKSRLSMKVLGKKKLNSLIETQHW